MLYVLIKKINVICYQMVHCVQRILWFKFESIILKIYEQNYGKIPMNKIFLKNYKRKCIFVYQLV